MKFVFVSSHLPERQGVAAGRIGRALIEGLLDAGHDVTMHSWSDADAIEPVPPWCQREPLAPEPRVVLKLRSLVQPRSEAARVEWDVPDDAICVADEYPSFPAVRTAARKILFEHHLARLDIQALGHCGASDLQSWRAQRAALRQTDVVIATSPRVAAIIGAKAVFCRAPFPLLDAPTPVDAPVAGIAGNWTWPSNAAALRRLLRDWPAVRARVPHAQLLVAGRGSDAISAEGVTGLGRLGDSMELLGQIAVVPFPCPPSSGPKVKVLEALSAGRPVVTTDAGLEGVALDGDTYAELAATEQDFAERLASLLGDPGRAASVGAAGRTAIALYHDPGSVARCWAATSADAFGLAPEYRPSATSPAREGIARCS